MSSMFQRLINNVNNVLEPFTNFAVSYVDDSVVFSDTQEEHVAHVKHVLSAFSSHHLRINSDKCQIGMTKIMFWDSFAAH